ncbi:MAG: DUF1570 domain-containing protein [Pirellulales bacterium]|nr:DUF1570 domain-containing protein [Pirellulales bacterium]
MNPLSPKTSRRVFFALISLALGGALLLFPLSLLADELARTAQELKSKYAAELNQLASWCDEKGLKAEARKTRNALGPHDPMKFYVPALPAEAGPPKLPPDAPPAVVEWDQKFNRLRKEQAAALNELARRAMRSNRPGLALESALDAIRANPDNESVRRLFGYQKYQNQWRTVYEVKKLRQGLVWTDKFGWLPKAYVKRYEEGRRFCNNKWITSAEDAAARRDIDAGWLVETEHYAIRTNHSLEAGVALGQKLERLYLLWSQLFIRYFATEDDVIALFDGRAKTQPPGRRHLVVYYRDRADYLDSLKEIFPDIEISVGFYQSRLRTAYFYADEKNDFRTLYHEATHQLFHESRPVSPKAGKLANFWITEGIALYMESLQVRDGFYELGGFDDQRMIAARYRLLNDRFYVPLSELAGYGMEKIQKDPRIATLYSQAAGLTHFLIHYDRGRYRDALVSYLSAVYSAQDTEHTLPKLTGAKFEELDQQYKEFMAKGDGNSSSK